MRKVVGSSPPSPDPFSLMSFALSILPFLSQKFWVQALTEFLWSSIENSSGNLSVWAGFVFVNHWQETVSKKFSRNFFSQNNSSFVEKSQPLTRNCVEKIQLKFLLPKQSQICRKKSTIDKKPCRKNTVEILPVETILIHLPVYLSKIFPVPFNVQKFYVEIFQQKAWQMWDFLQCRNYSWVKNRIIEYFRMSKKFSVLNLINEKVFECRKYSAF